VLFVVIIFLSNAQILSNLNISQNEKINNIFKEGVLDEFSLSSNFNISSPITGPGVDQDVRIYTNNKSKNLSDNQGYFEIPTIPTEEMFLTYGDFNFTFQNNLTTEYILEDDDALNAIDYISFNYDTGYSSYTWDAPDTYKISGNFNDLIDNSNASYIVFNATQGKVNFTISANFTDTSYNLGGINGRVEFNRTKILGFIFSLIFRIYQDANLTVSLKEYSQSTWKEVISGLSIDSSLGSQGISDSIINENLEFIDLSDTCYIQFVFERDDQNPFIARIHEFDMESTYAFDLPITNQEYVALEFDLKGKKSTVNGFYAWIRTLNLTKAATTQLNITLYRANDTVVRTDDNLRNIYLKPDYNDMFETQLILNYNGDGLTYFGFDKSNTKNLNVSNYFIVIKSDNPNVVYSLITLPYFNFGDDLRTEHQLKMTSDNGNNWINANNVIPTTAQPYSSGQLDASSFKLNVTRGYMPSDFRVNFTYTLRIQDIPVQNLVNKTYPYNESSYLEWGIGRWNNTFLIPIEEETNNFRVDLTWNPIFFKGFKFNVSYSVNAYWIESASTSYSVKYNKDPMWLFSYDWDKNDPNFNKWNFLEFWYVYPDYFRAHNLTKPPPSNEQILSQVGGQSILSENPQKYKVIVNKSFANLNGFYTLNLTSYNFIHKMHSYVNFNDILWETNGFMYGDNITTSVDIQDHNSKAPINGYANVTLFYPNGTMFSTVPEDLIGIIDGTSLVYDFDNATILELTNNLKVSGKYYLGFFWFNQSAIGCKKIIIYIDAYDVELLDCNYYPPLKKNVVEGLVYDIGYDNFTLMIASVNDTTGISNPNFYPVDNENLNLPFFHEIDGGTLPLLLTSFKQSENILNPNETIKFKASIQNLHEFHNVSVKVNVKLVSYANEEWIIAENTSNSVLLKFSGHPEESNEFNIDLKIPSLNVITKVWKGVNAPIRLAGAKTIITLINGDDDIGIYESNDISLLSNELSTNYDGYILGLRISEDKTDWGILNDFDRDECIYLPNNSSFLANIFDRNYVSSYNQFTGEFSLKLNSKFANITINPNNPIKGQIFNVSSVLTTEFGEKLINKSISCQYFEDNSWVNHSSDFTDSNGFTTFQLNTMTIDFEGDLLLRLVWDGDTINGVSKNITVAIIHENSNISLSITQNDVLIYKNRNTTFTVVINNIGDSNLRITNISIKINRNFAYSIVEIDYLQLNQLASDEHTSLIVEIAVKAFNGFRLNITIIAQNILTNEYITISEEIKLKVYEIPITDYFIEFFIVIIISAFILVWIGALIYARRTKKKLETPVEEPIKKRPRREKGKYVPVSELKKPTPIKKIPKKKEEPKKVEEKKKTDLDSLLEERGLADKKKKPKD